MSDLHIGTFMQIGTVDTRKFYLRKPANGVYEGQIVAGETWSANPVKNGGNWYLNIQFKMGAYVFSPGSGFGSPTTPTGVSTGVTTA